jgi:hypothetical protein
MLGSLLTLGAAVSAPPDGSELTIRSLLTLGAALAIPPDDSELMLG